MVDEFGKQAEELGKQPPETIEYPEEKKYAEEAKEPDETKEYSEEPSAEKASHKSASHKKEQKSSQSKIQKVFRSSACVVATVATVTVIAPQIFATDSTAVTFTQISVSDNEVAYRIDLTDRTTDTLTAVVYNDYTSREQVISGDYIEYVEKDLKPNVSYTLAVKNGDDVIAKKSFKTVSESSFVIGDYSCNCKNDGTFQFYMSVKDGNGWLSSFKATLVDESGNVSECTFSDNLNEMQSIQVTNKLSGDKATFTITCEVAAGVLDEYMAPFRKAVVSTEEFAKRTITLFVDDAVEI